MLLSGRVKPRADSLPNMTDANRICKEANFNTDMFVQVTRILLASEILHPTKQGSGYAAGKYADAFWNLSLPLLRESGREAFYRFIYQNTGAARWRLPSIRLSRPDLFAALFAAAFHGLAVQYETITVTLREFAGLPEEDLFRLTAECGLEIAPSQSSEGYPWAASQDVAAFLSGLLMCRWAYVDKHRRAKWFSISATARIMLGLDDVFQTRPRITEFRVLPDLSIVAGADMPPEKIVPLFRYCRITRIDRVLEFRLARRQFAEMPSKTSDEHELRKVLRELEPHPATVESFLSMHPPSTGRLQVRFCSAVVKPENADVLAAIRDHRRLKGYLEAGAPEGFLFIKHTSDPVNFVNRCRELGFSVEFFGQRSGHPSPRTWRPPVS